tara:strand:- start:349 stop:813 length:465 start_codon:yes stop_codon:yes gene_type:complete
MTRVVIPWNVFQKDCDATAKKVVESNPKIDTIIALARGGLVPARIMAETIKPKHFYVMGLKLYNGDSKGDEVNLYQDLPKDAAFDRHDHILVVDDVSDGGTTLSFARGRIFVQTGGAHIWTACPYIKTGTKAVPTYYSKEMDSDKWIVFPFEHD